MIRLHILHHASKEGIYGFGMISELRRHGYELSPGTLSPILQRLESGGYLESYAAVVAGKLRKVYRRTSAGKQALEVGKARVPELFGELFE